MTNTKKTESKQTIDTTKTPNWLDNHNLDEIFSTTKLGILEKYNLIPDDDFTTVRKVMIQTLPEAKEVEKDGKKVCIYVMEIRDGLTTYQLSASSLALQRSILECAIKLSKAKDKSEIKLDSVLNKLVGIKRVAFKAQGFDATALKFFIL